jgi:hypothetical protein
MRQIPRRRILPTKNRPLCNGHLLVLKHGVQCRRCGWIYSSPPRRRCRRPRAS